MSSVSVFNSPLFIFLVKHFAVVSPGIGTQRDPKHYLFFFKRNRNRDVLGVNQSERKIWLGFNQDFVHMDLNLEAVFNAGNSVESGTVLKISVRQMYK